MLICIHMLTKRAQILFEEDLWEQLVRLSAAQKTSIAHLVRKAVEEKYKRELELAERKAVLEEIEKIRPHFKGKIDYKELINYGRK